MRAITSSLTAVIVGVLCTMSCKPREQAVKPIETTERIEKTADVPKESITEKYWKLVALHGEPYVMSESTVKEPHIILHKEGFRFAANAGCNNIAGSYELDEKTQKIRFIRIIATKMMCMEMDLETQFLKILETVDNYSLSPDGKSLSLNRARMAPLAQFEAVYK
jgi:heat shock protein HslJ